MPKDICKTECTVTVWYWMYVDETEVSLQIIVSRGTRGISLVDLSAHFISSVDFHVIIPLLLVFAYHKSLLGSF